MRLDVNNNGKFAYDIVIENSFISLLNEIEKVENTDKKVCIVTDSNVESLYLEEVKKSLQFKYKVFSFVFKAGEESKNLDTVVNLYEYLLQNTFWDIKI